MEGGSLFNPGFLGGSFLWWVGQIPNDENWRENIKPGKFESPEDIPGWGYRYKVRIIGLHDQDDATLKSDQLPWAQVMYPITAGGGQGGSFQTPAIKQGNFVFGFFLDGQDQQVPVIMGVLGANAQTPKAINKPNAQNFTSKSGYSGSAPDVTGEKTSDDNLATTRPSGTSPSGQPTGGNNPNNPPAAGAVPTKETPTAAQQKSATDNKIEEVLDRKHALSCPDPAEKSAMKGIQTVIENLQKKIEKFQKSLQSFSESVSLNIKNAMKDIDKALEDASKEISKFMKDIYEKIQKYITDKYNKALKQLEKISLPTFRIKMLELKIQGLEQISCLFNKLANALQGLLKNGLANSLNNQKNQSPPPEPGQPQLTSPGSQVVPPLPPQNYYRPVPMCSAEELVAGVLGQHVNQMMGVYNSAITPVVAEIQNSLSSAGVSDGITESGSSGNRTVSGAISPEAVAAALQSGNLVGALSSTLAGALGIDSNIIGSAVSAFQSGNIAQGLTSLATVGGKNTGQYASALSTAVQSINNNDIVGGLTSIAGAFGADSQILSGVGGAFGAIKAGDIGALTNSVGQLAGISPQVLGAVQQAGSALASGNVGAIAGQLGALGGLNFDVGAAIDFISSLTSLFDCDPKPKCSPNDTHRLQDGGSGKPGTENPNSIKVAQATQEKALAQATGGGTLTGAGTQAEATALEQKPTYSTPAGEVGVA